MHEKEAIFLSVLERHKGIIYKVANTYCFDAADREDLMQEIILQVWLSLDRFNDDYKWSTWIYRVALNTSISFYRKNKTRKDKTVGLSAVIDVPDAPEEFSADNDFVLLRKFVRELREIDRALILLHLEGLKSKEIAEIIETSQTNVTTRISRIKKKLRLKFDQHKN
ncbi:RNA polymerase sigma factor [Neolewinella agarilytica]|uniref:RNA polymerase sigma factor n=1 Tax=Neolewinella agarilytica TaxID=478744 RepID=UPI002354B1E9|nr:sigma-70 family RNA polymerase sigma factor [Neolewinella agarilytica]